MAGIRLGLQFNRFIFPGGDTAIGPAVAATARQVEAAGVSSFWVMDHFFQISGNGPAEDPILEAYATLAYAAAVTERIKLGTMVVGVTYRYPGILLKTITSLDVLSGGRAYFGVGAGWYEREHLGLGVPFPPLAERFERLEETLQIAKQMWADNAGAYEGKHYQLAETLCHPLPLSKPHPPILIGGGGEQKTLRFVARYGDACNLFSSDLNAVAHKLEVLKGHCQTENRPYAEIEKTTLGRIPGLSQDERGVSLDLGPAVEFLGHLAELGIDQHLVSFANPSDPAVGDALARLVQEGANLTVAGRS